MLVFCNCCILQITGKPASSHNQHDHTNLPVIIFPWKIIDRIRNRKVSFTGRIRPKNIGVGKIGFHRSPVKYFKILSKCCEFSSFSVIKGDSGNVILDHHHIGKQDLKIFITSKTFSLTLCKILIRCLLVSQKGQHIINGIVKLLCFSIDLLKDFLIRAKCTAFCHFSHCIIYSQKAPYHTKQKYHYNHKKSLKKTMSDSFSLFFCLFHQIFLSGQMFFC